MKRLLLILILTLSFQTLTKAEGVRDFEIEGISIGDSLLDHYSKKEIESWIKTYYPSSDKYYKAEVRLKRGEYEVISFHLKKNDPKFIITELSGGKFFGKNFSKCSKFLNKVISDISSHTQNLKKDSYRYHYKKIEDGKSYADIIEFTYQNNDLIRTWCINWTSIVEEKLNFEDNFAISMTPSKHMKWINTEAYK